MSVEGLALSERVGAAVIYRANPRYTQAELVRRLLKEVRKPRHRFPSPTERESVAGWPPSARRSWGRGPRRRAPMQRLEEVIAEGLVLGSPRPDRRTDAAGRPLAAPPPAGRRQTVQLSPP